jgi:hypothetical protein
MTAGWGWGVAWCHCRPLVLAVTDRPWLPAQRRRLPSLTGPGERPAAGIFLAMRSNCLLDNSLTGVGIAELGLAGVGTPEVAPVKSGPTTGSPC